MQCLYCDSELQFVPGKGYVHPEGGLYEQECPDCGWRGAPAKSVVDCPQCGSRRVRDHHIATPDRSKEKAGV